SEETHVTEINTQSKLLTKIEIVNNANIFLSYEPGREDTNFDFPGHLTKLKTIHIQSVETNYDEKYELNYVYKQLTFTHLKRLFLSQLGKWGKLKGDTAYTFMGHHQFVYNDIQNQDLQTLNPLNPLAYKNRHYECEDPLLISVCSSLEML